MYIECQNNHLKHIGKEKDWPRSFSEVPTNTQHYLILWVRNICIYCEWIGLHSAQQRVDWLSWLGPRFSGMHTQPHVKQAPVIWSWSQGNHGSRATTREAAVPMPFVCVPHVCMKNLLSSLYLELVLSVTLGNKGTFIAKFRMVLNFTTFSICVQICVSWISLWSCWQHMTFWFWDSLIRTCIVIRLLTAHFRELSVNKSKSYELNLLKNTHEFKN